MDFSMIRGHEKQIIKTQEKDSYSDAPKKNCVYALHSRGDQEESPNVFTDMLQVFPLMSML